MPYDMQNCKEQFDAIHFFLLLAWLFKLIVNMAYTTVFFVLSSGIAITYLWLIPHITQFTSPWHRKFHVFPFNSTVFQHLEVYDDNGWKEYYVHITSQNTSCLVFLHTDVHSQWMKFSPVNKTFSFRIQTPLMTAIKLKCQDHTEFIFHRTHEWLVFPLLRDNEEIYVCPVDASCTFDVIPVLQHLLSEKESVKGLRRFGISSQLACIETSDVL